MSPLDIRRGDVHTSGRGILVSRRLQRAAAIGKSINGVNVVSYVLPRALAGKGV